MGILQSLAGIVLFLGLKPSTIAAIIGGIVIPTLSFFGGAVWWFHKRLQAVEESNEDRENVVYGGENNPLNLGLVKEVKSLKQELNEAKQEREELRAQQEQLMDRLDTIEDKLDKYNGHGDDEN